MAAAAGVRTREVTIRPEELGGMDECLLLSTTKDVTPIAAIDGYRFKVAPDSVTARLKTAFAEYTRTYAAGHPELRV